MRSPSPLAPHREGEASAEPHSLSPASRSAPTRHERGESVRVRQESRPPRDVLLHLEAAPLF